jgi:hypothetical protein
MLTGLRAVTSVASCARSFSEAANNRRSQTEVAAVDGLLLVD